MTHLYTPADLVQYGISLLTGEADPTSLRILCDLNAKGAALVADFLGMPEGTALSAPWNSTVMDEPSVGSVMLPRTAMHDLMLYALLTDPRFSIVIGTTSSSLYALAEDHPYYARWLQVATETPGYTVYRCPTQSRNTHQFTGRTV